MTPSGFTRIREDRVRIYCLYFLGFMDLLSVSMGVPLLVRRARELGATPSIIGLIGSVYGGIQLFSSPLMGKFSDVAGRKKILLLSLLGTAVGYFVFGLTDTLLLMALGRIPVGIFKQTQGMCKACLADITSPLERPMVFGNFNACASLGFVIGPLIGGHLAMTERGFFKVMVLQSILFLVMFAFAWFYVENDAPPQNDNSKDENAEDLSTEELVSIGEKTMESGPHQQKNSLQLKNSDRETTINGAILSEEKTRVEKSVMLSKIHQFFSVASLGSIFDLLIVRFLMGFSMIVFRSNFTSMLEFRYNTTPKINGYIMSFNGMVSGFSGVFVGKVLSFYNNNDAKALFHFSIILASAILCITYSPDIWVLVICIVPLAFSSAVSRVCSTNLTLKRGRSDEKGVLLGVSNSLISVARMLSPALAGFVQEISMYGPGLLSVGIAIVGIFMIATKLIGKQSREEKEKEQ